MRSKRVQIHFTPQQRQWVINESRRREISMAALVREAIDALMGAQVRRKAALAALAEMRVEFVPIDELNELIALRG